MRALLEQYFSSMTLLSLDYSAYESLSMSKAGNQQVMHIPSWNDLNESRLEWIIQDYYALIYMNDRAVHIETKEGKNKISDKTVFEIIKDLEKQWKSNATFPDAHYFGLLSYDLGNEFLANKSSEVLEDFYNLPTYYLIIPGNGYLIDHTNMMIRQFQMPQPGITIPRISDKSIQPKLELVKSESKEQYKDKIKLIQNLIREGEVYQLNYTTRFSSSIGVSGYEFFKAFYSENPAPYSVYISLHQFELISNSPERFLMLKDKMVDTEPIKGTIHRDANPQKDQALQNQLLESEKDAAELSMIVDLLRNDLSRVCKPGSVNVKSHKQLKSFKNVHHLVSTISGILERGNTFVELLESAFPGGSITGCPKKAAMNYIQQLEEHNRSFYTGNFFIHFPAQDTFDSSILIRSAIKEQDQIHFQAGGGIVIDSDADSEYAECLSKADSFLLTLEQINARDAK